jgi:tetratricopeptide (TPR) repeat protein
VTRVRRGTFVRCATLAFLVGLGALSAEVTAPEIAIHMTRRGGLPARAAALLVSGQQGGPIALSALAVPLGASGGKVRLGLVIDVDGGSLLGGRSTGTLPIGVAAYLVSPSGGIVGSVSTGALLDLEHGGETIARRGIKLLVEIAAPPGASRLRALVYVPEGLSFGVIEVPLGATSMTVDGSFIAPPLIGEPADAWLLADDEVPADGTYPFVVAGEAIVPATRPVLAPAAQQEAWLITRGQDADLAGLGMVVLAPDGAEVAPVQVHVLGRVAGNGVDITRVALDVPDLPVGAYSLRVTAAPAPSGEPPAAVLPVVIAPRVAGQQAAVWTAFATTTRSEGAAVTPVAATQGKAELQPVATLKAGYIAALGSLARGGRGAALAAIAEMESAAMSGGSQREARRLLAAEATATRELLAADPGSLLALLAFHLDLHQRYGQTSRFSLQAHTSQRIEELAVAVAFRGGGGDSRALAAAALACFAGERHGVGDLVIAARMYRKVLFLEPANPTALAGLAAVLEAAGLFKEAVPVLELLVEKQPDNAEARLRLAVNLYRVGEQVRATTLLESCTAPESPAWVRAVAFQEQALHLIEASKWSDALAVLDLALAAIPDDQGLIVERAFVLDRSGRATEARAAARRLVHGRPASSPRYRYARSLTNEASRECAMLAARQEQAEAALVRALAAPAETRR